MRFEQGTEAAIREADELHTKATELRRRSEEVKDEANDRCKAVVERMRAEILAVDTQWRLYDLTPRSVGITAPIYVNADAARVIESVSRDTFPSSTKGITVYVKHAEFRALVNGGKLNVLVPEGVLPGDDMLKSHTLLKELGGGR